MKTRWFVKLALSLATALVTPTVSGQIKPAKAAGNTTVTPAEVAAFMQEIKQDTNGIMPWKIPTDPKRVPLLLGAIEREPAGPWVMYLHGICFGGEHNEAARLPEDKRATVYAQAIEYLTAARMTVSNALQADGQNRTLKDYVGTLDLGLALAYVESGTRLKEARALAEAALATNTVTNWNYGNLIYNMHSLLGRIALREGNATLAKKHLAASGKTPGSPQLNSFGPDFVLARELLEKGERDAVLAHLDQISSFWGKPETKPSAPSPRTASRHEDMVEGWRQAIRSGQIPNGYQWKSAQVSPVDSTPVDEAAVQKARRRICGNQLRLIESAKQQWALDKQQPENATPAVADLVGYLPGRRLPKCPDGGNYTLGQINQNPRCSVAGHELSKD